ncbi:MAG: iron export ABC transporter permease subunit FetB [candidate division Zixibacteria bacterium]|nr:iron export ABC transporter permease subunit FetB [candidate division Zixibacteria bacterium]
MIDLGYTEVLLSSALMVLALVLTFFWKIPVQKDIALGSVRAFVQLVAVGYALKYIFDLESPWLILLAMLVMLSVGAYTAAGKAKDVKNAFGITLISMLFGSAVTLGLMLALGIVTFEARYVIPLAGMIIGNSMNAAALTMNRISTDLRDHAPAIEAALALGKSWRTASRRFQKEAAIAGMLSMLNFLKTVGLVALPGAMTGMILAGAEPLKAVLFQIIVGYMLLGAVSVTSIMVLELTVRQFFTRCHQLLRPQG